MEQPQAEGDGAVQSQVGHVDGEYQLFVNRREEICVMQSSADVDCGRYIKVKKSVLFGFFLLSHCIS